LSSWKFPPLQYLAMVECRTCELLAARDAGDAPPRDNVIRTAHWDVVHAFGTAIEGWLVLVLRRHASAISELNENEAAELGPLLVRVSTALEQLTGCERTYFALFAEDPAHRHVHVHVVPRFREQPDELRGVRVFSRLGLADEDSVPPERMDELSLALRDRLG
jgi:diadenosine tetraphosphate (Ap4A) HIT family hydrolase